MPEKPIAQIAQDLGIAESGLRRWKEQAVKAHNLGRAVDQLAGLDLQRATAATLRRKVFTMPGRLVHTGRRRHLRLPTSWP